MSQMPSDLHQEIRISNPYKLHRVVVVSGNLDESPADADLEKLKTTLINERDHYEDCETPAEHLY